MKIKKLNRIMVSFAVSAALLAEPVMGMPMVYAQENQLADQGNTDITGLRRETSGNDEQANVGKAAPNEDRQGGENEERPDDDGQANVSEEAPDSDGQDNESEETPKTEESGAAEVEEPSDTDSDTQPGENGDETEKEEPDSAAGDPADSGVDKDNSAEDTMGEDVNAEDENAADSEDGSLSEEESDTESGEPTEDESEDSKADKDQEETGGLQEGFSDMPAGYRLTSFQRELKADLADMLNRLQDSDEGTEYASGRVVTFADSREEAEMIAEAYHAEIDTFDMGVLTLKLGEGRTVREAVRAAASQDNTLPAVWPDYRRELYGEMSFEVEEDIPSVETYAEVFDELYGDRDPYLDPADNHYQWFHTAIGSPYAWDAGYTGQSVVVGIIDSGVSLNPDLDANVIGRRDFCDETPDALDCRQHGTHVAGIIAALANGVEGTGVAPDAKIYNARVFGDDATKSGYDSTIMRAILYLISEENNATKEVNKEEPRVNIINMSLGGSGDTSGFQAVIDKAYAKGVIVFAATGNDGDLAMMYPASYEHVIAVSATDKNNERAYFANYGPITDLSAPGVDIWAAYTDGKGNSGYASLQGTSMSCPVAAGQAAVILSGQSDLPALQEKTGAQKVDALEAIMKENAVSVGNGMGRGITSLTKVFNLTAASAKPNAPSISVVDNSGDTGQSVQVTITAQAGMKLCYTTNGKNPVYKNETAGTGTVFVDDNTVTFTIDGSQAAQGTVKAFAINEAGVVSQTRSGRYKLSPYIKTITVTGPTRVEKGKSIRLTAAAAPSYAADKALIWDLRDAAGQTVDAAKIRIDANGKITASSNADAGIYTITVRAKDNGGAETACEIEVIETGQAVSSLVFDKTAGNTKWELWITKDVPEPMLDLAEQLIAKEKDAEGNLTQISKDRLDKYVTWSSSKPAVAAVDDQGVVTAKSAGSATITAKAKDNGSKKATIKVTVKQGVTDITITTADGNTQPRFFTVAAGKSMTLKASVDPAKPTNKKVQWSISPQTENVKIGSSTGKITVAKGTPSGSYTVTAEAADGKGAAAVQVVQVYGGAIGRVSLSETKATLYTKTIDETKTNTKTITATLTGADGATDFDPNAYTVTSSNPSVVSAETEAGIDGKIQITLTASGDKYGKAKVTVAATDGSNKKAVCTVTVSGGIKSVSLQDSSGRKAGSQTLFRTAGTSGKAPVSKTLKAVIAGSDGANTAAYDVESSNPSLVKVAIDKETNEVTLRAGGKSTGKAKITLKATDGSGKKASVNVTVINPPSGISIAPKAGKTRYVVPGKSVQLSAALETEYGQIANKKVDWSVENEAAGMGITVNASGKVLIPGWMDVFLENWQTNKLKGPVYNFEVHATARDGSGLQASYTICLRQSVTHLAMEPSEKKKAVYILHVVPFTSDCTSPMSCTSSSLKTASPSIVYTPYDPVKNTGGSGFIMFMATKPGKATFTVKALDSSGKVFKSEWEFVEKQ